MSKNLIRGQLANEVFSLKRTLKIVKATLVLRTAERDTARQTVQKFNFQEALAEIQEKYGLNIQGQRKKK